MNIHKIRNIIKLDNEARYSYAIREFVKLEKIWAISTNDSWVTFVDNTGDEIFPIWPHKEVAEICIFDELKIKDFLIDFIEYDKFKEFCIPDMVNDEILFGIFYNDRRQCLAIDGVNLLEDLNSEELSD